MNNYSIYFRKLRSGLIAVVLLGLALGEGARVGAAPGGPGLVPPPAATPAPKAPPPPPASRRAGAGARPKAPPPAARRPADFSANGWTNLFPSLYKISAISADEFWALGQGGHVLRYAGGAWTAVDPPAVRGLNFLADISMVSSTSGWIAAEAVGNSAFYYDGTTWAGRSAGLVTTDTVSTLYSLDALAADDVWAMGRYYTGNGGTAAILHWNGTQWAPTVVFTGTEDLRQVAMASATEGWAVGGIDNGGQGLVLHYNGGRWQRLATPTDASFFYQVWAGSAGDAWIGGSDRRGDGAIFHVDAHGTWQTWSLPGAGIIKGLYMAGTGAGWASSDGGIFQWDGTTWGLAATHPYSSLGGIAGAGGQVWAVGKADQVFQRSAAGAWTQIHGGPMVGWMHAVAAVSATDAWAVGEPGATLHWDGRAWRAVANPITATLTSLQVVSATEIYAAGGSYHDGVIAHWDGGAWRPVLTTTAPLAGLVMRGPDEGWAVGARGSIWRAQGGAWAPVASPVSWDLNAVAFDSSDHGWAVGGYYDSPSDSELPGVLEYTGGAWLDRSAAVPRLGGTLRALLLLPGGEGWAGGSGSFLHLRAGQWTTEPSSEVSSDGVSSLAADATGGLWGIGGDAAYHYTAADPVWRPVDLPPRWGLSSLSLLPGGGGWAVGSVGTILRYDPRRPGQRFYDVPATHPFYTYIAYMAEHGIISGYADGTFRPYANITRGQLTKMVVAAQGWAPATPATPTFGDVPATHPFYGFVEAAVAHSVLSGYADGSFRPAADVTRGQAAKILVNARGWGVLTPATPRFADVPATHPFYGFVEQAAAHQVISGYACGGADPCPGRYFHPSAPATRAQLSKLLYLALVP